MHTIYKIILLSIVLIFTSCSSKINLLDYKTHILHKAKYMPSKSDIKQKKTSIIISSFIDKNIKTARNAKLGKSMVVKLNSILTKHKSVKVLKRLYDANNNKMLKKEIKLAEIGKETGDDVGQAKYIITGNIGNASYTTDYIRAYFTTSYKDGKKIKKYNPPQIISKACTQGHIQILELPSLDEVMLESFDECERRIKEAKGNYRRSTRNDSLVRDAGISAVKKASFALRNFFAKKGYISEAKIKDDEIILKTTLGSKYGAMDGKNVKIFSIEQTSNALTGDSKTTSVHIGDGVISNEISEDFSWIIVDKVKTGKSLHIGDYIKILYKKGFWSF